MTTCSSVDSRRVARVGRRASRTREPTTTVLRRAHGGDAASRWSNAGKAANWGGALPEIKAGLQGLAGRGQAATPTVVVNASLRPLARWVADRVRRGGPERASGGPARVPRPARGGPRPAAGQRGRARVRCRRSSPQAAARRVPGHRPDPDRDRRPHRRRRCRHGQADWQHVERARRARCSWSATRSSRSTGSVAPTSPCTCAPSGRFARHAHPRRELPNRARRSSAGSTTCSPQLISRSDDAQPRVRSRSSADREADGDGRAGGRHPGCGTPITRPADRRRHARAGGRRRRRRHPPGTRRAAGRRTTSAPGERDRLALGDIAILVPARTSLPFLEDALDTAGIPYRAESSSLVYQAA